MSKKEETQEVNEHLDPNMFGYKVDEKAPFKGETVLRILGLLDMVRMEGTKTVYKAKDTFKETIETPEEHLTELALQAVQAINLLMEDHTDNVKEGRATHQDILMGKRKEDTPTFKIK